METNINETFNIIKTQQIFLVSLYFVYLYLLLRSCIFLNRLDLCIFARRYTYLPKNHIYGNIYIYKCTFCGESSQQPLVRNFQNIIFFPNIGIEQSLKMTYAMTHSSVPVFLQGRGVDKGYLVLVPCAWSVGVYCGSHNSSQVRLGEIMLGCVRPDEVGLYFYSNLTSPQLCDPQYQPDHPFHVYRNVL